MSDSSDPPDCPGCRKRDQEIAELREEVEVLKGMVAKLQARLDQNSTNSNQPPSSDGPADRSEREHDSTSERAQGAQPGHEGTTRESFDDDDVDEVIDITPDECRACGDKLEGHDDEPSCHQVTDVRIRRWITEYRRHTLTCSGCGCWTHADLPDEVPSTKLGPTVAAIVTYLTGAMRVSKRKAQQTLAEVFDIDMCVGTVSNMEARLSKGLEAPYRRSCGWIREAECVHLDETSWWQRHAPYWLWTATDGEVVTYTVSDSRSGEVARALLGGQPSGRVVTDRFGGYNWIETASRRLCWPHLYRNFKGWALEDGLCGELGGLLASYVRELFRWLERIRDGTVEEASWRPALDDLRERVGVILRLGAKAADPGDRFEELLDLEEAMWAFVDDEDWRTDNNAAERALRGAVMWRRRSFGTQSERGSRFTERILTVVETLKRQGRGVMDYLEDVWSHLNLGADEPRLLPT